MTYVIGRRSGRTRRDRGIARIFAACDLGITSRTQPEAAGADGGSWRGRCLFHSMGPSLAR